MRLIDADALIDAICQEECGRKRNDCACPLPCLDVVRVVKAPTIEAEAVKHGRWVPSLTGYPF